MRLVLTKRLRIEGFIVMDSMPKWPAYFAELGELLRSGRLVYEVDVVDGLKQAPKALRTLYAPGHRGPGKLVVRVSPEPDTGAVDLAPTPSCDALEEGH